jgi:preprotein translocase subunit SecE
MEFLQRLQKFVREVTAEFKRVNWPSRTEVANSTVIVLVLVFVLAFYLGAVDVGLSQLYLVVERVLR